MSREIQRIGMAARYSEAAVFNGVVYLAGMVPERGDTDITGQTADVLAQVEQQVANAVERDELVAQLRALGRSPTAKHFGLENLDAARAYLTDPLLGAPPAIEP